MEFRVILITRVAFYQTLKFRCVGPKKVVNMDPILTTNTFDEDTGPVECRIVASRVVTFQATF